MCGRVRWLASFRPGVHLRPGGRDLLTPLRWSVVGERKATAACSVSLSVTECLWQGAEPEGESRASDPALWLLSSAFSGHSRRKQTVGGPAIRVEGSVGAETQHPNRPEKGAGLRTPRTLVASWSVDLGGTWMTSV